MSTTHLSAAGQSRRVGSNRNFVTRGVFAIPMLPDGVPDATHAAEGIVCEIGQDEVVFELALSSRPATAKWIVGVENAVGDFAYFGVRATSVTAQGLGLRITASLLPRQQDPLRQENISPAFDPQTFRFRTPLPADTIRQWIDMGVIESQILDRVLVCPQCHALPTFRRGCRACGSTEVNTEQLLHHFACAHVERKTNFEAEGQIVCPKCRARRLIVGADFEYLQGPFVCRDCSWSDIELATIGRCAACAHEFSEDQAFQQEVTGYHVDRLDPLALVAQH